VSIGTWLAPPGEVGDAVVTALREGYRHIDCALIYKNEAEVGEGIKRSGVPRNEIFIASKLWNSFHPNATESLRRSLEDLDTDYLGSLCKYSRANYGVLQA
jgi:glycerol 2-dehydrogenase (NADP+)